MTSDEAIAWVEKNRGLIINRAQEYTKYVPYDIDDYIQEAYASAIEAAVTLQRNPKLEFKAIFLTVFRRNIAKVTPFTDEEREEFKKKKQERLATKTNQAITEEDKTGDQDKKPTYYSGGTSMSFPTHKQTDIVLERVHAKPPKRGMGIDIEKVYRERVQQNLSDKERVVMELALGLTSEGRLSDNEIAKRLGVARTTILSRRLAAREKLGKMADVINMQSAKNRLRSKRSENTDALADEDKDFSFSDAVNDGFVAQ